MSIKELCEKYNGVTYAEIRKLVVSGFLEFVGTGSERGYISKKVDNDNIKAVVVTKGKRAGLIKVSVHNELSTRYVTNLYFKEGKRKWIYIKIFVDWLLATDKDSQAYKIGEAMQTAIDNYIEDNESHYLKEMI